MKWYHNATTGEELQLPADEDILIGFTVGRLPKELAKKFNKNAKVPVPDALAGRLSND